MKMIDPKDPTPKHSQLRKILITKLQRGDWTEGDQLPPETQLAQDYGLARNTVRQALQALVLEGYLEKIHGKGTFIKDRFPQKLRTWAILVNDIQYDLYSVLIRGFEDVAQETGIQVIIGNSDNLPEKQSRYIQQMIARQVDGLAIVPIIYGGSKREDFEALKRAGIPFVFCNRYLEGVKAPRVICDNEGGACLAVEHLIELGHTKIAYLSESSYSVTQQRLLGYQQALQQHGIPLNPRYVKMAAFRTEQASYEMMKELLRLSTPPTAIFAFNDRTAAQAYQAILENGLSIPQDISVVGFDDVRIADALEPGLTTMIYPKYETGREAGKLLLFLSEGELSSLETEVILKATLKRRGSTTPPRT